jgi:hypothetical protein
MADLIHPHLLKTPETMNRSKISRILVWSVTLLGLLGVSLAARQPNWVESQYSTGVYPAIGRILRSFTGIFPFSVGDVFYTILSIVLIIIFFRFVRQVWRKELKKQLLLKQVGRLVLICCWVYIGFYGIWGLNYYRAGIASQLNLQVDTCYDQTELKKLRCSLMEDMRRLRWVISKDTSLPEPKGDLFKQAEAAYAKAALVYPFLAYQQPAMKKSLFGALGKYGGYTGYYNPSSGEGQIRWNMPGLLKPFTICHEMAHQLGYASESEANFVAYLVCMASEDPYFQYSAVLDIFHYVTAELMLHDPEAYVLHPNLFFGEVDTMVQRDRLAIRRFFLNEQNNIAPVVSSLYNQYLLANNQIRGVESYYDVVAWVLALRKKRQ